MNSLAISCEAFSFISEARSLMEIGVRTFRDVGRSGACFFDDELFSCRFCAIFRVFAVARPLPVAGVK